MRRIRQTIAVAGAVLLLAAACGDDADTQTDTGAETDTADLPVNEEETGDDVISEPACLPDEPDCDDTVVVPDEAEDLGSDDETSGEDASSSGMTVDGGLTIAEALATDATGVLAVKGHGFVTEDGALLCESLAPGGERYECGGASLAVENLDLDTTGAEIVHHAGLSYTDGEITVFGQLVDGVLVIDPLVTG